MKPQPLNPTDQHMQVQELLLWHTAGSLTPEQHALVRRHLEFCTECREDAALGLQLAAADPAMPPGLDPERALARLMPRLDTRQEAPQGATLATAQKAAAAAQASRQDAFHTGPAAGASRPQVAPRPSRAAALLQGLRAALAGGGWRNWALAAQCAVIAGLALLWQAPPPASEYRVLGSGAALTPDVVVVFKPDTRVGQVRQLLQASGARIVGGPTVTGAYLLDVDTAQASTLLATLRADPAVQLAEPLNGGAAPAAGARP